MKLDDFGGTTDNYPIILFPAYGRKYRTEESILDAYFTGKDFKLANGPYCSCRDFVGDKVFLSYAPGLYAEAIKK